MRGVDPADRELPRRYSWIGAAHAYPVDGYRHLCDGCPCQPTVRPGPTPDASLVTHQPMRADGEIDLR